MALVTTERGPADVQEGAAARPCTDITSLNKFAGIQQLGLELLQRKARLHKHRGSFEVERTTRASEKVMYSCSQGSELLTLPTLSTGALQAAHKLKGQALEAQHSLRVAQRELQHWKWRAGLLQLQASGREEVLELARTLEKATAAECTSSKACVAELTAVKAGLQARPPSEAAFHGLQNADNTRLCRQSLPRSVQKPSSRLITSPASRRS